jgi:hypothetical protein
MRASRDGVRMRIVLTAIFMAGLAMAGGVPLGARAAQEAGEAGGNGDAVAVIIGNRDYAGPVPDVEFARNDARAMRRFVGDILGFRADNIIALDDASQAQLFATFGNGEDHRGKLWSWVKAGASDVVVFYSGHGVPGVRDGRGYLLPVDADPDRPEINGYPLDLLYHNLALIGARSVTVYIDACFSGESPRGMVTRAASNIGLAHVPRNSGGGLAVITAARGDQLASWDEDAKHGLFTRYLLLGLYGAADREGFGNDDGRVTLSELGAYLDDEMTYAARRGLGREQNATLLGDAARLLAALPEGGPHEPPVVVAADMAADGAGDAARAEDMTSGAGGVRPLDAEAITRRETDVYAGPSMFDDRVARLAAGRTVRVTGRSLEGRWFRVALTDGPTGFVPRRALRRADAPASSAGSVTVADADPQDAPRPHGDRATRALRKPAKLYAAPSLTAEVVIRMPAGGEVEIIRRAADRRFVEARYRNRRGFVLFSDLADTLR